MNELNNRLNKAEEKINELKDLKLFTKNQSREIIAIKYETLEYSID